MALPLWQETVVKDSEIDSLGHMNVRFYLARANYAARKMTAALGLVADDASQVRSMDVYSRFAREQFAGNPLETRGGHIPTESADGIGCYFEIVNPESGDTAASFILQLGLVDRDSQVRKSLSKITANPEWQIELPDHARPRSLQLTEPRRIPLEDLEGVISVEPTPGMMSGRREGIVLAEDCDDEGRLREDIELMALLHRPAPGQKFNEMGPPQLKDEQGRRYSWAMMETRSVVWQKPSAGDTVVSMSADISLGEKWRQSRRWMYVRDTGVLLAVHDTVGVCIDLDARRAMPIPAELIGSIERNLLPQFA